MNIFPGFLLGCVTATYNANEVKFSLKKKNIKITTEPINLFSSGNIHIDPGLAISLLNLGLWIVLGYISAIVLPLPI